MKMDSLKPEVEPLSEESNGKFIETSSNTKRQYLATFVGNLLMISYGASCGWTSPSLPILESHLTSLPSGPISKEVSSWIGSIMMIGGLTGTLLFGVLVDMMGRKKSLCLVSLPLAVSWLLIVFAQNSYHLIISRFIGGIGGGGIFIVLPTYVTEISETSIRGQLGSFLVFTGNIGMLSAYVCGTFLKYDVVPWVFFPFPVIFFIVFLKMPETPIFLMQQGHYEEAERSLKYYRGVEKEFSEIDHNLKLELENLKQTLNESNDKGSKITWEDFASKSAKKSMLIGMVLMTINQLCGCFAMLNYTASIFAESGSSLSPNNSSIIVGAIQMCGCYLSTVLVERSGRKILLSVSLFGTSLGLLSFGAYSQLTSMGMDLTAISWVPLAAFSFTIFIANLGVLTLPFLVVSELVPQKIKGFATSFCMSILWCLAFLVIKYLSTLIMVLKMHGVMYTFAINSFLGAIFVILVLPETKGRSYEEIMKILEQ